MLKLIGSGVVLGLSAGFAPGPLTTLVISQTLLHGRREGAKVAVAPLVTDLPIILISVGILSRLADSRSVLGVISLVGGAFVLYLSLQGFRSSGPAPGAAAEAPRSWTRGVVTNFLSPNPYLFWMTVGAPAVVAGGKGDAALAVAFVASFWGCLVGTKLFMAWCAGTARDLLTERRLTFIMRGLALLLLVYGAMLLRDALRLFDLI